jgi:threonine dehydrogenase-like Zn-dependent dehydrogenase
MYKAHDVRLETVPDAAIIHPTDAVIRVTHACICGSDLWPFNDGPNVARQAMGHEAIGIVEAIGSAVERVRPGQLVIMPFAFSDGHCLFCDEGLQTACVHGGFFGVGGESAGAQAEALRVPYADGTLYPLYPLDAPADDALLPGLLALSDVMGPGHHAAVCARVTPGSSVAVVGDGAVGLCGVIAAKRLGAEQIIIMGRHADRTALARELGATNVVAERGDAAVEKFAR